MNIKPVLALFASILLLSGCGNEDDSSPSSSSSSSSLDTSSSSSSSSSSSEPATGDTFLLESYFPDPAFVRCINAPFGVEGVDLNLELDDLANITSLYCDGMDISSIEGIENLPELSYLKLNNNALTSVDLSRNLKLRSAWFFNNQIEDVVLAESGVLESLALNGNPLTDATRQYLHSVADSTLIDVNVPNDPILGVVFTDPNFAHCVRAEMLFFSVTSLDELGFLGCSNAGVTSVAGLESLTNLTALHLRGNQIEAIDLNANQSIAVLDLDDNPLSSETLEYLDSVGWISLMIYNGETRDMNMMVKAPTDYFADPMFAACVQRGLNSADNIASIEALYCDDMGIESIEGVEHLSSLVLLKLNNNNIFNVDLSANDKLEQIWLINSGVSFIEFNLTSLHSVAASGNPMSKQMISYLNQLPDDILVDDSDYTSNVNEPILGVTFADPIFAHCVRVEMRQYGFSTLEEIPVVGCTNAGVKSLSGLESLTGLELLFLSGNQITDINIDTNTELTLLTLDGNPLSDSTIEYLNNTVSAGLNGGKLTILHENVVKVDSSADVIVF